jgi:peptidyl-prolyl cis-trans isomerase B (cyclophilin B)
MPSKGVIKTRHGNFEFELFDQATPNTVKNFVQLAQSGFYDDAGFHRVIPSFVVQGGCPQKRGTGGPGYSIKCELKNDKQYHDEGVLSMAHAGRNTGGSQFFVVLTRSQTKHLDGNHTCFGKLTGDLSKIHNISEGDGFSVEITSVDPETESRELQKN